MGDTIPQKANGLKTVLDTIIAPKEAFESLGATPTWAMAFLVFVILFVVGFFLQRPASIHAGVGTMQHMLATNAMMSGLPDDQKSKMIEKAQHPGAMSAITGPLFAILSYLLMMLLNAVFLLIAASIGKGKAGFSNLWAASVNIAIPTIALPALVLGIICILRGPDAFNLVSDIVKTLPNLGMIAPGVTGVLGGMLASLNIFTLWGLWLNMQALRWTASLSGAIVWVVPALITVLSSLMGGWLLSFAG